MSEEQIQTKKVYCENCRFLRQPIEEENRKVESFFGGEQIVFFCAAPVNLIKYSYFLSWKICHRNSPECKNQKNDCPDFETVEQAIS